MYNWFKKVNKKKLILGIVICLVLFWFLGTFIGDHQVFAQGTLGIGSTAPEGQGGPTDRTGDSSGSSTIARFLTWVVYGLVWIAGKLLMIMISILMGVVNFNDFVNARAVAIGWVMVRDLSNIFFVFVMLLIAFGTLFNIQTYEYKKLLPKLIIAVVLVNFSKMIVGLFIDFGQVIMLTFVNAFKDVAAGAIVNGLGLERMFELRDMLKNTEGVDINDWSIFGSTVLAFIMLTIAAVVILTMIVVLLFRIIMLWVLVIFSPFAFVASLIPNNPLQKVSMFAQYWGNLSKYIIVGPILAFFLWLSFSILAIVNVDRDQHVIALYRLQNLEEQGGNRTSEEKKELIEYMASKVSSPQNMFDFMVTIALLIGSLTITQQMGVMGGSFGVNAVNRLKKWGTKAAIGAARVGALALGRKSDKGLIRSQKAMGIKKPMSFRPSKIKEAWQASRKRKEDAFYGERGVVGGMEDKFNNLMSLGKDKTYKGQLEHDRYIAERRKEIQESPSGKTEKGIAHRFKQTSNVSEKEATLYELILTHGLNEVTDDRSTSSQAVKRLVVANFGDGDEGMRVMDNLQEMGVNNKDAQLYATVNTNVKTGKREWTYKDENDKDGLKAQAAGAAEMNGRKTGYSQINTLTKDAYEVKDGELTVGAGEMFKTTAVQLGRNFDRIGDREQKHLSNNVGAFKKFADAETNPEIKKNMYQAIGRMINPNGKGAELFKGGRLENEIMDEDASNKVIEEHRSTSSSSQSGTVDHKQEVVNKTTKINENEEKITKLKREEEEAKVIKESEASTENIGSEKYKKAAETETAKKKERETLEQDNNLTKQKIMAIHQPELANQAAENLDVNAFNNQAAAAAVSKLSDKIAKSVDDALANIEKPDFDFSKVTADLQKPLNSLAKQLKKEHQEPVLGFAAPHNLAQISDRAMQTQILTQLKKIAGNLSKAAKPPTATDSEKT